MRFIIFSLIFSISFAKNIPNLGSKNDIISVSYEKELGEIWLNQARRNFKLSTNPIAKDYIKKSISKVAKYSDLNDFNLNFIIIDNLELNAFASFNNIVGVNTGLLLNADTEAQYLSVITHELGHLSQRHLTRNIDNYLNSSNQSLAITLSAIAVSIATQNSAALTGIYANYAYQYQNIMRYSRMYEQEADRIGIEILHKSGFNVYENAKLLTSLQAKFSEISYPEFLLTHPLTISRISNVLDYANIYKKTGKIDSLEYQLVRANILSQNQQKNIYKNKEITLYYQALQDIKNRKFSDAGLKINKLLDMKKQNIYYHLLKLDILIETNPNKAQKEAINLHKLYPFSYLTNYYLANIYIKNENYKLALQILNKLIKNYKDDLDLWEMIIEANSKIKNKEETFLAYATKYTLVGDYKKALKYLQEVKNSEKEIKRIKNLMENEKELFGD